MRETERARERSLVKRLSMKKTSLSLQILQFRLSPFSLTAAAQMSAVESSRESRTGRISTPQKFLLLRDSAACAQPAAAAAASATKGLEQTRCAPLCAKCARKTHAGMWIRYKGVDIFYMHARLCRIHMRADIYEPDHEDEDDSRSMCVTYI